MKKVFKVLRELFGSKPSSKNDYLVWAKTEYKSDWQFAYQHMLDHQGAAPTLKDLHPWNDGKTTRTNNNLTGWV
tara:strand:+ start:429 stop:650 length:222 start_codon:yes stop_codon:yes gene_type:complete